MPYIADDATGFVGAGDDASFAVVDRASGRLAGSMGVLRSRDPAP